ncbi:MAG TPA: DUF4148 domain-containing protein [Noviherbaspirillum sp.]|uniref:DUF4148 domain-containing protein n=1 Tax=Noviherbaspirillum sp. TaxID=1926288 RepID=UPI002B46CC9F|nr:DUF4148 domain-containing protein [Noviherbaspirillum sp.]HJV85336.1 DUF4148 domain-containing protein [Noviherbaspirillum sp.]
MKSRTLATTLALSALFSLGTLTAHAGNAGGDNWVDFSNFVSTKTRAQVIDELVVDRAQAKIGYNEESDYPRLPVIQKMRSRAEVRAEALAAAKDLQRQTEYSSGQ